LHRPAFRSGFGAVIRQGADQGPCRGPGIEVFTYPPIDCARPAILFGFHGAGRTAKSCRNGALPLPDKACLAIYASLFDKDSFPIRRYQSGGGVRQ